MCTRYISPEAGDIERLWRVGGRTPMRWVREVFPATRVAVRSKGAGRGADAAGAGRELRGGA